MIYVMDEAQIESIVDELKYFKKIKANILSDFEGVNEVSVVDELKLEK